MEFIEKDRIQFEKMDITSREVNAQLNFFKNGFPHVKLLKPATLNNGIIKLLKPEEKKYIQIYNTNAKNKKIIKFVPASGAATRMFKPFYDFLDNPKKNNLDSFIKQIHKIAFYDDLKKSLLKKSKNINALLKNRDYTLIINEILSNYGLNYKNLPKGLIKFHKYSNFSRTAFEEHIIEAFDFCKGKNNEVHVHFTISPEHDDEFRKIEKQILNSLDKSIKIKLFISYSNQNKNTDTLAVDTNNKPFRLKNGSLYFRPGGHGALLKNLNTINGDVIFIKNIDNIAHEKFLKTNSYYKKILGGYLIDLKQKINQYIELLEGNIIDKDLLKEVSQFMQEKCLINIPEYIYNEPIEKLKKYCYEKLNRPVRICGMVKNEGQPGGGPFWVKHKNNSISLQIIESAQIDKNDKTQTNIFQQSTHFNPVDIVCNIKNIENINYNLFNFRDNTTGFISKKTFEGDDIKALELPGLWNGSMANWITVFIEVPKETFNPVKTIFDLLNKGHLS